MTQPFMQLAQVMPAPFKGALTTLDRRTTARAPTGLHFVIADRLAYLNASAWDEVTTGRELGSSRTFLEALERSATPQLEHRYALGFRDGRPVLAVSMQLVEVSIDRLRPAGTPLIEGLDTMALERSMKQRALVCGNVFCGGFSGATWVPELDDALASRALGEVLYRVRRAEKLNGQPNLVVVKDLTDDEVTRTAALEDLSYRVMDGGPTMTLALSSSWKCHNDYLAEMVSKYRSAVKRKVFAPISEAGCTLVTLSADQAERYTDRLQSLYLAVQDNASLRPATVGARYWAALARHDAVVIKAITRGDEVLGFLLMLINGDTLEAAQIGFDREAAKTLPLYLRLLHAAVEEGLARGCTSVSLGRTALEPKARLGARPVQTHLWVRHRVPVVNTLTRGLVDLVKHAAAPDIDPFKNEKRPRL